MASNWMSASCKGKLLLRKASLNPLALRKQIGNFGWKDKRTSVITLYKLYYDFGGLLGKIFMQKMACGRKDLKLKFACIVLDTI